MTVTDIPDVLRAEFAELLGRPKAAEVHHTPETIRALYLGAFHNVNTLAAYTRALDAFEGFYASFDMGLFELDRENVRVYLKWLRATGSGAQKINQHFAAIRGFYEKAMEHSTSTGVVKNPAKGITLPPMPKVTSSTGLTIEQADMLMRAAAAMRSADVALKATAVVRVLLTTGLRASELVGADAEDFDPTEADGWASLAITRKGGARDRVEMPPSTKDAVQDLLDGRQTGPLLLTRGGGPESVRNLENLLGYVGEEGHLEAFAHRLKPHNLRVAYATFCHAAEDPLLKITRALGHAKPDMTMRYILTGGRIPKSEARRVLGR